MNAPITYVVGFLFNEEKTKVALVRKERPTWQAGKLNGIGGKIDPGESAIDAMIREFEEETGTYINTWSEFACLIGPNSEWIVYFYKAIGDLTQLKTMKHPEGKPDEPIEIHAVNLLPSSVLNNINWLVPMSLDSEIKPVHINYI